ncbi:MAG: RAMP superfamily CRISPR-associated protein [Blastocatellia bacterium]
MPQTLEIDRSRLRARYIFTGRLVLDTALHIGGGRESATVTDSPILRDSLGQPLIPGSSFKGAFRAGVERILPNLPGFRTCLLVQGNNDCLSTNKPLLQDYGRVSEAASQGRAMGIGNTRTAQDDRNTLQKLSRDDWKGKELDEDNLLNLLDEFLCDTCKTFGSVYLAAAAQFHDLPISVWAETTDIRDGVGIDRDSERAIDQIKFDYEVVPARSEFEFRLTLENPCQRDLGLIAIGLQEFTNGMIPLGGIRSRGLGRCHLEDVKVAKLDFSDPDCFRNYLLAPSNWAEEAAQPLGDFINRQIDTLLP